MKKFVKSKGDGIDYRICTNTNKHHQILNILRDLKLSSCKPYTKFIPKQYLYSSVENRLELLMGLFDGDGCNKGNINEYSTSSPKLANDIMFLCESLGMTVTLSTKSPKYSYKGNS